METPRLRSEYCAARAQSEGLISATADADIKKSNAKIADAHRSPVSRRKKGRGGSPEPPGTNVTTDIASDSGQSPLPSCVEAGVDDPVPASSMPATGRATGRS